MGQDMTTTPGTDIRVQMQWAKAVSEATIIPDVYQGRPSDILIAEGFGAAMGLSPAESLYRVSVIKGKPTMSAELIASQVRRAGHKLRLHKDEKAVSVTATIVRADDPDYPFTATRDMQWAHRMGLDAPGRNGSPSNYLRQPITMLTWRAISAVAREACPEALYGAGYTPDEMDDAPEAPTASESEHVEVHVVATKEQRKQLFEIMRHGGVHTKEQARTVLRSLVGVDSDSVRDIPDDDVLMLLEEPQMVETRVRYALGLEEHPTAESETQKQQSETTDRGQE